MRQRKNKKTGSCGFSVGGDENISISVGALLGVYDVEKELQKVEKNENQKKDIKKIDSTMPKTLKINKVSLNKQRVGRNGKFITVVTVSGSSHIQPETLLINIKKDLGCGGRLCEGKIILQGDIGARVVSWFRKHNVTNIIF